MRSEMPEWCADACTVLMCFECMLRLTPADITDWRREPVTRGSVYSIADILGRCPKCRKRIRFAFYFHRLVTTKELDPQQDNDGWDGDSAFLAGIPVVGNPPAPPFALRRGRGKHRTEMVVAHEDWFRLLRLGMQYGWHLQGTRPITSGYFVHEGQRMTARDARSLGLALARSMDNLPDHDATGGKDNPKSLTHFEYFSGNRKHKVFHVAHWCLAGAFEIW